MTGPSYHALLAVDIESYGRRTELVQGAVRGTMYACVQQAAGESGLPWDDCVALDRGDSIILLVPPSVAPTVLLDPFVARLDRVLRGHRVLSSGTAAVRLRVAVHAGFISPDERGWMGTAINSTCRMLDAQLLRDVLAASTRADVALIVSDNFYQAMVIQGHVQLDATTFHPVRVRQKETDLRAWVHVPGYPRPDGLPADEDGEPPTTTAADAATAADPANGGGPRIGGHAKVGGGIAGGDIHVSFGGGLR